MHDTQYIERIFPRVTHTSCLRLMKLQEVSMKIFLLIISGNCLKAKSLKLLISLKLLCYCDPKQPAVYRNNFFSLSWERISYLLRLGRRQKGK